jgi:uncharacterized protein YndB with AHSA1/START domain
VAEITRRIVIDRPADEVWAVLAHFDDLARWAPNVDHSSLTTAEDEGIGVERRVQVGRNVLLERVTEWEPGRRLSYTIDGLPPVIRSAANTWTLAEDHGATAVAVTSRIDAGPRPPQQLVARAVGRMMGRASERMLDGLNNHLAAQPVAAPTEPTAPTEEVST